MFTDLGGIYMFRDFLWLLHSKQSYDMQKSNGLPGFIALVTVLVVIFKWNDWFAPIFFALRLDKLPALLNADHGDFYAMTFIHMTAWFLLILISIPVLILIGYILFISLLIIIYTMYVILKYICTSYFDLIKSLFKSNN